MKKYECDYDELKVSYSIEGDVDGNSVLIKSIEGISDFEYSFDKETLNDIKFICQCDLEDKQLEHYLKTGQTI